MARDVDSCFCRSYVINISAGWDWWLFSHYTLKTSPLAQQLVPVHSLSSAEYDY